jgi:hypothetical protein
VTAAHNSATWGHRTVRHSRPRWTGAGPDHHVVSGVVGQYTAANGHQNYLFCFHDGNPITTPIGHAGSNPVFRSGLPLLF